MKEKGKRTRSPMGLLRKRMRSLERGAQNALAIVKEGRLGAPYSAPFEVAAEEGILTLRRYLHEAEPNIAEPLLLVPPLMVATEIYDISPELSAVGTLLASGVDVWVVDFGAPETVDGGMKRTLDDHVLAVARAIELVAEATGRRVHLAGYSQGGMFCYQAAAYLRSAHLSSLITFGSPVDIRRNLPVPVYDDLAGRFLKVARSAVRGPLGDLEGLPSALTARGFKMLSPRKEVEQLVGFLGLLHDRGALERREPRRRFLNGDGFVAWPGPAFRQFVEDMVVQNRMTSGGFVIGGKTLTLADITCPILAFVGLRDDMARPASVRAIKQAAPAAEVHLAEIEAGHFGLVVGSRSLNVTWPAVESWLRHRSEGAPLPSLLGGPGALEAAPEGPPGDEAGVQLLYDLATDMVDGLWGRLGDVSLEVAGVVDTMRWQLPRLARLRSLHDESRISVALAIQEQADAIGEETFFLWRGRAYTYDQANARIDDVLAALFGSGMRDGWHVAVLMNNHPDYLTTTAAINRASAVGVLLNSGMRGDSLRQAVEVGGARMLVCDVAHQADAAIFAGALPVLVIGASVAGVDVLEGLIDLDAVLADEGNALPPGFITNAGRARDLAFLMYTSGTTGLPKAARITNRRWALAALGAAAACRLTSDDTVYCPLPLHHATGMLVAVGGALIGGARLALAPRFSTRTFWNDVRRYGVTVVFYVGELCRYLVTAPEVAGEDKHPVRLFVGNGLRPDVWERLLARFGPVNVLEFYGSTEGNVALANLTGRKIGSVGRPIADVNALELVRVDVVTGELERSDDGLMIPCGPGEPGMLLSQIVGAHPLARFDGYLSEEATANRVVTGLYQATDRWFNTGDLLRRDEDGDYWFVDRLGDTFRWKGENVSTEQVASVMRRARFIEGVAVYGVALEGFEGRAGMAAVVLKPGAVFDGEALGAIVTEHLFEAARPVFVRLVDELATTSSHKLVKSVLMEEGANRERIEGALYRLDEGAGVYVDYD